MKRVPTRTRTALAAMLVATLCLGPAALADETADLAKQAQNPIANLISLPLQNNTNFNLGPHDRTQNVLNIQPVAPFGIKNDWTVITRTIAPLIWQPDITQSSGETFGLGDINSTAFFSPPAKGKTMWGVGPIVSFPTATDDVLGTEKWSIGPSVVVVSTPGKWVLGALVNNIWSVAGPSDEPDVNKFLFQYFVNYNFSKGWYLTSAPIITADWNVDSDNRWIVPFGIGFGKLTRIGSQPINLSLQGYYNVESPEYGPDWTLRVQMQFLFPKGK